MKATVSGTARQVAFRPYYKDDETLAAMMISACSIRHFACITHQHVVCLQENAAIVRLYI